MGGKADFDEDLIRKLADLLNETGLTEIEYEMDDLRLRVAKERAVVHTSVAAAPAAAPAALAPTTSAGGTEAVPAGAVTSPMVGTVYTSSEPGASPFVKVGDSISEGQTLFIIEAMKVMNPLPSPRAGKVTQILVRDGQPVEFGEPLIVIE